MAFHAEPSSGHPLDFDDRTSNTGGSPVETVLSALGACTGMDVISIMTKKRQDVTGYRVEVSGTQRDEYPQVYARSRRHARGRRPGPVGGGDPPRDRAVGAQVLPGQRDGVGGCHDRAPSVQDPFRGGGQLRHRGRGDLHRPVPPAGRRSRSDIGPYAGPVGGGTWGARADAVRWRRSAPQDRSTATRPRSYPGVIAPSDRIRARHPRSHHPIAPSDRNLRVGPIGSPVRLQ